MIVETDVAADVVLRSVNLAAAIFKEQSAAFLRHGPPALAERLDDLERLRRAIKHASPAIVAAIRADFGNRAEHETLLAEVWPALTAIRHVRENLSQWMKPRRVATPLEFRPARAEIIYQPVGVVGIISPWNYPFQLAIMPLIDALGAGNRVMLHPSEQAPHTSEFLAAFLNELFTRDKVATILGGPDVAAHFASLPFNHLFFTGSSAIGRKVMRAAAENLTPVTLELGGKSPCIVGEDAPLGMAAARIASGKLLNAGQTCVAPDYLFVPRARLDDFIGHFAAAASKYYPHLDANPDYTTIINERHFRRLRGYVDEARARGMRVVEINPAKEELGLPSRAFPPTLVIDPSDDLALMREEIFGPILPVKSYLTIDEAIDYINARPRPLALYYFGTDTAARDKILHRTTSGGVSINDTLMHVALETLPFGGAGESGLGAYHGEAGFETFSHRKSVFVQSRFAPTALFRPPFGRLKRRLIDVLLSR